MHFQYRIPKALLPIIAIGLLALVACNGEQVETKEPIADTKTPPNILLIIGDDMGKDTLSCFDVGNASAHTPNLDRLCREGARFDSMWTQPYCSPTRATLLTGEYGFQNGVYTPVIPNVDSQIERPERPADAPPELRVLKLEELPNMIPQETIQGSRGLKTGQRTLAQFLREAEPAYATGAFGKWHLADHENGGVDHPNIAGFDHFSGYLHGTMYSFFSWKHVENGEETPATGYFTTRMTDDAIDWINAQEAPWFAWLAYTAPHEPYHLPPTDLLSEETARLDPDAVGSGDTRSYFLAALEAMDFEIGRLISEIPDEELENTFVLFIGDNGSPGEATTAPYAENRVKGTVFQGGIDMPFIIRGPGVEPGVYPHLANSTDIFSAVLELAGIELPASESNAVGGHSISFIEALMDDSIMSPRDWAFSDGATFTHLPIQRAVRDDRYKLIKTEEGALFFDLDADPYEQVDLLQSTLNEEQQEVFDKLNGLVAELRLRN